MHLSLAALSPALALLAALAPAQGSPVVYLGGTAILGRANLVHGAPLQEFFGGPSMSASTSRAPPIFARRPSSRGD